MERLRGGPQGGVRPQRKAEVYSKKKAKQQKGLVQILARKGWMVSMTHSHPQPRVPTRNPLMREVANGKAQIRMNFIG